jgi:hypothetical protein
MECGFGGELISSLPVARAPATRSLTGTLQLRHAAWARRRVLLWTSGVADAPYA